MNQAALLTRFRTEAVTTASPARLLTMLYDRLVLDLDRAIDALHAEDRPAANEQLTHAQDIVHELRASLDINAWDGARGLMDLYNYLFVELVSANISGDPGRVAACRDLVSPLRDAWHEAAAGTSAPSATTPSTPLGDLGVG